MVSVDLPYGVEARFVFPVELDENQVHQALDELGSVLPYAIAHDQRRSELMRLADSDSYGTGTAIYVYDSVQLTWMDIDKALRNELRQRFEGKEKNCPPSKNETRLSGTDGGKKPLRPPGAGLHFRQSGLMFTETIQARRLREYPEAA